MMTQEQKIEQMKKLFNKQTQIFRINRMGVGLKKIYAIMVGHNAQSKLKMEQVKISKAQIKKFLQRRYNQRDTEIILNTFKFLPNMSYSQFVECVDRFIQSSEAEKCMLGFKIHDLNGDGVVCAGDIGRTFRNLKEFDYLLNLDLITIMKTLAATFQDKPKKSGYIYYDIQKKYYKELEARGIISKQKAQKLKKELKIKEKEHHLEVEPTIKT